MFEIPKNSLIVEVIWLAGRQHRRLPRVANTLTPPLLRLINSRVSMLGFQIRLTYR